MKRLLCLAMTMMLLIASVTGVNVAYAADVIEYTFCGDEAALPGYAEGIVKIVPPSSYSYCHLYWADDVKVLDGYEKIATIKINSASSVEFTMPENMIIPYGAKNLAVFFSDGELLFSTGLYNAVLYEIPEEKRFVKGNEEMTFASVSDIHVNYSQGPELWTKALDYFNELDLEMVVVSGDATNEGSAAEYTKYNDSIAASQYPAEKIYTARGNHDSQQNANYITYTSRDDMVRPFENSPWFYVLKKGDEGEKDNLFIFLAQELDWGISNTPGEDNFSAEQLDWFEGVLKQFAGTNTNIFIAEHAYFHNWGPGDRYDGIYVQPMKINDAYTGNMRFQRLLMEYKSSGDMSRGK